MIAEMMHLILLHVNINICQLTEMRNRQSKNTILLQGTPQAQLLSILVFQFILHSFIRVQFSWT